MNILALDLGTHCGFALQVNGDVTSGTFHFEKSSHPGERFAYFNVWLRNMALGQRPIQGRKVDLIVYEKPLGRMAKSQAQVDLSIGFKTRLEEFAYKYPTRLEAVPISTLKKATTGNGRAEKIDMVNAVNALFGRGLTEKEHDEADALALLHYARQWEAQGGSSVFIVKQPKPPKGVKFLLPKKKEAA